MTMHLAINRLKTLAAQKITKRKLQALQDAHTDADALFNRLCPKSDDEDTTTDFENASGELESALADLDSAISDLENAEDKDEREDASSMVEEALGTTITAFDDIMPLAVIGNTPRPAPSASSAADHFDQIIEKHFEIEKLPEQERAQAWDVWVKSAGDPALVQERQKRCDQLLADLEKLKQSPRPPP
jgi:hypothetical protein